MTREAFENVIVVNSAIGGSTNAPIHINAIARHIGVELNIEDWQTIGHKVPLLVNLQPAGKYLGEDYQHAGGVPAVVAELMKHGLIHESALTVNGKTIGENCRGARSDLPDVIRTFETALVKDAGFIVLKGNLFDSAIMKTSVISEGIPRALSLQPGGPERLRGPRHRLRGSGGLPRAHRRSGARHRRELHAVHPRHRADRLSGRGGGREHAAARRAHQERASHRCPASATGASPARRARPRSSTPRRRRRRAAGSRILRTGDRVRIDLDKGEANILISDEELAKRRTTLQNEGGFHIPGHQTPWQEIQRSMVDQLGQGMVLKPAVKYQRVAQTKGMPRDNH